MRDLGIKNESNFYIFYKCSDSKVLHFRNHYSLNSLKKTNCIFGITTLLARLRKNNAANIQNEVEARKTIYKTFKKSLAIRNYYKANFWPNFFLSYRFQQFQRKKVDYFQKRGKFLNWSIFLIRNSFIKIMESLVKWSKIKYT